MAVCALLVLTMYGLARADVVTLFHECVPDCGIPDGWTVERHGAERSDTWGDPYPCGMGMSTCPPTDPTEGRSFICASGGADPVGPDDEWLISPSLDASGLTTLELTFLHAVGFWDYCDYPKSVMVSADGGPFQQVWSLPCGEPMLEYVPYEANVDLSSYAGCSDLRICFRFRGTVYVLCDSWLVDDVTVTGDTEPVDFFLEMTFPEDGGTYRTTDVDNVLWDSNIPAWPGSPDVLDLYWRECGGEWVWFGSTNNDATHPWPFIPCEPGCYEVKIEYSPDPSVADSAAFQVIPHYVEITQPVDGETYRPCPPATITWNSSVDYWEGSVIAVSWRECGESWQLLGAGPNDGRHTWWDPPCEPGCYEVLVDYTTDSSVADTVGFFLVDGELPDARYAVFVEFSGDASDVWSIESRIDPPQYDTFYAYLGAADLDGVSSWGLTSLSFAVSLSEDVFATPSYENLLPGDLAIGSWETGITLASTECVESAGEIVYFARVQLLYVGGQGDVELTVHPDYPRWVLDCNSPAEVHEYCVLTHGGVWKEPPEGDPGCTAVTVVRETSWGAIKAMYR
jgi:hypothetical protein